MKKWTEKSIKNLERILWFSNNFRWKSWIFSKMKFQGYWCIFIRIMRKSGFFVKGYPFDSTIWKTKSFHNHPLDLIKKGLLKIVSLWKLFGRTKWLVFLELWWKKIEKVNSKFIWISILSNFIKKSLNFQRKNFFVGIVFQFFKLVYLGKLIFCQWSSYIFVESE